MSSTRLFWSRSGEVACESHRPDRSSRTWSLQGWAQLPSDTPRTARYQCQYCGDSPIRHDHRLRASDQPRPVVLSVDPEDSRRARRARQLREQGFNVIEAADVAAALTFAHEAPPNLMVVGTSKRTAPGSAMCARLKAHPLLASVPTVLVGSTLDDVSSIADACLLEETSKQLGQVLRALLSIGRRR
jgi:CheY-like chemotaxis protein